MSSLQIPFLSSSSSSSSSQNRVHSYASITVPKLQRVRILLPKKPITSFTKLVYEFNGSIQIRVPSSQKDVIVTNSRTFHLLDSCLPNRCKGIIQLHEILKILADRIEMQKKIGQQRNNRNLLLLNSIKTMLVRLHTVVIHNTAFKLTSTLLFTAAKGILLMKNKIQTTKRNATTLFKQLHTDIQTKLTNDYKVRVFESQKKKTNNNNNGWTPELEMEMRQIMEAVKKEDMGKGYDERLGTLALKVNKTLAILGPLFTVIAALGTALERHGSLSPSSWAGIVAVTAGSLAEVINPLEGMALAMYRKCGGGFLQDTIEATLGEKDCEKRENGQVFEMKVAMKLGRSVCQLRQLAAKYASACDDDSEEGVAMDNEFSLQVMYSILT